MILAIDPGKSGGLVWGTRPHEANSSKMPDTLHDLVMQLGSIQFEVVCYMEKVGGYIGKAQPGSAMFKFGQNYGQCQGVLATLKIPMSLVNPQKWQAALALGNSKGMSKTQWKNKLKSRAQELYPKNKITLATADAFLIYHAAVNHLI